VAVMVVPAVMVVVAAKLVVVVKEPGAVIAEGREKVIVLPEPVEVIWLAVPKMFILPAVGLRAPPLPPVKVTIAPVVPEPRAIQVSPDHMKAVSRAVLSHRSPLMKSFCDVGLMTAN
jgi:hypothetical protein